MATLSSWPSVVWDAPILRGLDARARSEIEAAGRLRELGAGDVLYTAGAPADTIFVVVSGECAIEGVRRGESAASILRRARRGEAFGEEATITAFPTRGFGVRSVAASVVAEVPVVVLKRAIGRAGGTEVAARIERGLRRAATLDVLRASSFTRDLPEAEIELLLDAARHRDVPRGDFVFREGDEAIAAYLVAEGLLQVQSDDDGKPRVEAYLGRGDLFGEDDLAERAPRSVSVVAGGPTWLVALPRDVFLPSARRNAAALEHARRVRSDEVTPRKVRPGAETTAHVFQDLYRMRVARSLLVIDQDACIRCGHCASSCADAHADGVSRLVRRGDKIVVSEATDAGSAALLVPNSCQHCKNPSCMIDCPTGAIGRDARGEVFIREDLCTGCGSCAKACPWDNIQIAPRRAIDPIAKTFPAVAVKCDLCKGISGGPACVSACPTQAIARIDPNAALIELRVPKNGHAALPVVPRAAPAWPWMLGGLGAGSAVTSLGLGRFTSGVVAGVVLGLLVFYAAGKRVRGPLSALRGKVALSRGLYVAHLTLGALGLGAVLAHAGAGLLAPNGAGALTLAMLGAILSGTVGAIVCGIVPRALTRVERKSVLPEELALLPKTLDEKIFAALSGKSELVKTLFGRALGPYRRARLGPVWLVLSRKTLRQEEKSLRGRLDRLTGGKKDDGVLRGLDDLVRLVVEHRAVRAQRLLTFALRGWLIPHLALTVATVVLVVVHVVVVTRPLAGAPSGATSAKPTSAPLAPGSRR